MGNALTITLYNDEQIMMKFLEENLVEWLQRPELAELRAAFSVHHVGKNA